MASTRASRVRVGPLKDTHVKVDYNLNAFQADHFEVDGYLHSKCSSLNEKELRQLRAYLLDLKKASAEEMRKSVYANYSAFIRTSKEISDLEGELSSIRKLLSTQATLVHGLVDGINADSSSMDASYSSIVKGSFNLLHFEPSDIEKQLAEFPYHLDVLLAERRVDEALTMLDEGERVALEANERNTLKPELLVSLQNAIADSRQKLADQLVDVSCRPSTHGAELRVAISALKKLGDGPRAHTLLLNTHFQRLQCCLQSLRPSNSSYGGAYTAALSQLVFSAISQAVSDSSYIFGKEPAYTSELIMWATKQAETFACLVKRHALASSAAAGGLRAAAECVQIALGHCLLLEARGLALSPVLLRHFRPSVEQALEANLKRIEESSAALAAVDDWVLTYPPASARTCSTSTSSSLSFQHKLSSSAQRFSLMVQNFFEDAKPLLSIQLRGQMMQGVFDIFSSYVNMLIKAIPSSMEEESNFGAYSNKIVRLAETESQQIALLANASLLADEILPRAATKLAPAYQIAYSSDSRNTVERHSLHPEQREWKKQLVTSVDRLKESFCRQHVLDLIITEEGDSHLTAEMYTSMEGSAEEMEWFPSPIFQELFLKLSKIAAIASDVFVGKERFVTLLLMRLTETVILCLSKDQSFWDDIDEGPKSLGPLGLQQFYLDMKFVVCIASQGRFLSRNLNRAVNEIISKVLTAFSSTGLDPYSVLPEDEWFVDICQEAIERLSGKPKGINGDMSSPTASVSAQSISSSRSLGSC